MNLTIDANVWLSAGDSPEKFHLESLEFLEKASEHFSTVYSPTLLKAEIAASITRKTGQERLARQFISKVESFLPHKWVNLDSSVSDLAAESAIKFSLRGADAVYVATARRQKTLLITWDEEMVKKCSPSFKCVTPHQWLKAS